MSTSAGREPTLTQILQTLRRSPLLRLSSACEARDSASRRHSSGFPLPPNEERESQKPEEGWSAIGSIRCL